MLGRLPTEGSRDLPCLGAVFYGAFILYGDDAAGY